MSNNSRASSDSSSDSSATSRRHSLSKSHSNVSVVRSGGVSVTTNRPSISSRIQLTVTRSTSSTHNNKQPASSSSSGQQYSNNCQEAKKPPCPEAQTYTSAIETALLRANLPIEITDTEEVDVNGERGILMNRDEIVNWKGVVPLSEYEINEDSSPEIITKKACQNLQYVQELAIRYLRPPTPPPPGEILIHQECNTLTPPAPPLIIRQQPCRPSTPEPLIIREAPPKAPPCTGRKLITISGKRLPPAPRKVIIERLAPMPCKPQSVIIERWLPYSDVKRRVIFQKCECQEPVVCKPKNVIVQWQPPEVCVRKEYKYLGVIRANPNDYVQRYGASLTESQYLPDFVKEIKTPDNLVLAADHKPSAIYELEGDVHALKLVDIDKEGLSEYKDYLKNYFNDQDQGRGSSSSSSSNRSNSRTRIEVKHVNPPTSRSPTSHNLAQSSRNDSVNNNQRTKSTSSTHLNTTSGTTPTDSLIETIFKLIDRENTGRIRQEDAEKILLRLNSRLCRRYGEDDVDALFDVLDEDRDRTIDFAEFRKAFLSLQL